MDAVEIARRAGLLVYSDEKQSVEGEIADIERLIALVRKDEQSHIENNQDLVIAHMVGYEKGKDAGVLAEREACAKVCEEGVLGHGECAAAIRARGEK